MSMSEKMKFLCYFLRGIKLPLAFGPHIIQLEFQDKTLIISDVDLFLHSMHMLGLCSVMWACSGRVLAVWWYIVVIILPTKLRALSSNAIQNRPTVGGYIILFRGWREEKYINKIRTCNDSIARIRNMKKNIRACGQRGSVSDFIYWNH